METYEQIEAGEDHRMRIREGAARALKALLANPAGESRE